MHKKQILIGFEQYEDYVVIKCPVCGYENVAPTCVNVIGGIDITSGIGTRIDASGTSVYAAPAQGRGVRIDMTFSCECQHSFVHSIHFNKGQSHLSVSEYPYADGEVIWRD